MKPSDILFDNKYSNTKKLGIYVKNRRNELGLTIKDFAEKSNLSPAYICDIENGKRTAPLNYIQRSIDILKIEKNEINYFYDLAGLAHTNWKDLNEYFNKTPNARKFLRISKNLGLTDNEIAEIILSHKKINHTETDTQRELSVFQ